MANFSYAPLSHQTPRHPTPHHSQAQSEGNRPHTRSRRHDRLSSACGLLGKADVALFRPAQRFVAHIDGQTAHEIIAVARYRRRKPPRLFGGLESQGLTRQGNHRVVKLFK